MSRCFFTLLAWNHSVKPPLGYKRRTNPAVLFFYTMTTPQGDSVATIDSTELANQIVAEDDAAFDAAVANAKGNDGQDESSTSRSSDENDDKGQVDPKDEKSSDEINPPEDKTPKPEKEPKSKEEDATPIKLGTREFASIEDAMQEANRIVGRNGQLAGEIDALNAKVESLGGEVNDYKGQLEEAYKINQEWAAWYQKTQAGEKATPPDTTTDIKKIVADVLKTQKAAEQEEATLAQMKAEFAKVEAAPNYAGDVQRIVHQLSDKINPFTGRYFTPLEAYDTACKHLGAENALIPKPNAPAPKPAPKPATNPALVKMAARNPAPPSGRGASKPVPRTDDEDDYIDRSLRAGGLLPI